MNDECPICDTQGYVSDDKRRSCDECGHYDESYHHGQQARRREQVRRENQREWESDRNNGDML